MNDINNRIYYEFVNISPTLRYILKHVPIVPMKKFIESVEPADLITAQAKYETYTSTARFLVSRSMGLVQGGNYITLKMAIDNRKLIGYGTEVGTRLDKEDSRIRERSLKKWLSYYNDAILIRVSNLTEEQRTSAVNYMKSKIGLKYSYSKVAKSPVGRIAANIATPDDANNYDPGAEQFCSSIIAYAFKNAGVDLHFRNKLDNIWPRDFLLSPHTIKICRMKQ